MKLPKTIKISGRVSSVTNSFVQAIVPTVDPTDKEINEALCRLNISRGKLECVYCGEASTDWDHLRPLVRDRLPTGYINEIRNLVPSCSRCNQSKSGSDWKKWMLGNAPNSPKTRNIPDLDARVERLVEFERWGNVKPLPFADIVQPDEWQEYWGHLKLIESKMREAQKLADRIKKKIRADEKN